MDYQEPKPSDQIRELFASLGWTCNLSPRATEDDWRVWLEHFRPPLRLGNCPECGGKLLERNGKYGRFAGCSAYPDCSYTSDLAAAKLQTSVVTSADLQAHSRRFQELQDRAWRHFRGE
jgi:hypothetical protein